MARGGSWRQTVKIGIIAEDDSDVAVISHLTLSLLKPNIMGFKKFVGDGCGKLRRKCGAWALNLVQQGCHWIVVLHDLDEYDEVALRKGLEDAVANSGARAFIVLVPKRELEAWLLYDATAIARVFNESSFLVLRVTRNHNQSEGVPTRYYLAQISQKIFAHFAQFSDSDGNRCAVAEEINFILSPFRFCAKNQTETSQAMIIQTTTRKPEDSFIAAALRSPIVLWIPRVG